MTVPKEKIAFLLASPSGPIQKAEACEKHVSYLENGPWVMSGIQMVHSLFVDRNSLIDLYDAGEGGMRLYFCRENDGKLNIILAAVDAAGDITGTLVNNLEPCPNQCPCNYNYEDSWSENDLNYVYDTVENKGKWCKPNIAHGAHESIWYERNGTRVARPQNLPIDETGLKSDANAIS